MTILLLQPHVEGQSECSSGYNNYYVLIIIMQNTKRQVLHIYCCKRMAQNLVFPIIVKIE